MPRKEAAAIAASVGFTIAKGISKKVDLLVIGDHKIDKLAGFEKSTKHRRAEELIQQGYPIRIVGKSDFLELASHSS